MPNDTVAIEIIVEGARRAAACATAVRRANRALSSSHPGDPDCCEPGDDLRSFSVVFRTKPRFVITCALSWTGQRSARCRRRTRKV